MRFALQVIRRMAALCHLVVATALSSLMVKPRNRVSTPKPAISGPQRLTKWATSLSTADFHPATHGTAAKEFLEMASMGQVSARKIKPVALIARFTALVDFDRN